MERADKRWTQVLSATLYLRKNLFPPPWKDYFCVWGALSYLQTWFIEWMTDLHTWWGIWGDLIYILGGELDLFCEQLRVPTSRGYSAIYRASGSLNWIFNIMPSYRRTGRLDLGRNFLSETAGKLLCRLTLTRLLQVDGVRGEDSFGRGRHFSPQSQRSAANCCAVTPPEHTDAYKAPVIKWLVVSHKKRTCNLPFNPLQW